VHVIPFVFPSFLPRPFKCLDAASLSSLKLLHLVLHTVRRRAGMKGKRVTSRL